MNNLTQTKHSRRRTLVKLLFSFSVGLIACTLIARITLYADPGGAATTKPYIAPSQLTSVPFGSHSHWLQPWRADMETVPATIFLNGTGIQWNVNNSTNPELVAAMLAKHGIRRVRIEIGWGEIDFDNENTLIPRKAAELRANLLAFKKYGLRPLILLNSNQGMPTPAKVFERTVVADAKAGDTQIELENTSGIKVDFTGLSNLTDYWAAEALVTNIDGNVITLSKPLPKAINDGTVVSMATLKYRPFEPEGNNDYENTIAGWQRYVGTVAKFVTGVLGTTQSSDKGFDMEIWNELTFGSDFLFINQYYDGDPYDYDEDSIYGNIVRETVNYVNDNSGDFLGVLLSDGFASTIPWPASSTEPERIHAISKHPYAGRKNYPRDEKKDAAVNALGREDASGSFVPTYSTLFPEYYGTALQTETLIRDMGLIPSDVQGTIHGRKARVIHGEVIPTLVWITEVNISPEEDIPNISLQRADYVKAKTTSRYFSFYLNKGAVRLYLFAATGGIQGLGIVNDNFLNYAKQPNTVYPTNDASYTSSALAVLNRMVGKMSQQVDRNLTKTRPLQVVSISDTHNHYQFAGNGTTAHPNLYNRDVFSFLPYQVNAKRFVIPYYVMTRDIMKDLKPEKFTVQINGVKGSGASVTAYDPLNNKNVPVVVKGQGSNSLSVELTATDYPYMLTIQEA